MDPDVALHLEIAAVVVMAVIIVAVAVMASGGACDDAAGATGSAAVHGADVEAALGDDTLMTYELATARKKEKAKEKEKDKEEDEEEEERCALCLSDYGEGDAGELVRVVPACGHFYHASCGVDKWLRKHRTCPLCRGGLRPQPPLPGLPRPECPPMPPRMPPSH